MNIQDKIQEPELINNQYHFRESINLGIITGSMASYTTIETRWSKDLKFLKMFIRDHDVSKYFTKEGKLSEEGQKDYDGNRALRAKHRHLRWLRIYLGLEKKAEPKKDIFILRRYYNSELQIVELPLTQKGTPKIDQHNPVIIKATKENAKLAMEYNQKLKEFEDYKHKTLDKIFKDK